MCWFCGSPIEDETIGRALRCETCGKDLRVCRHCRSYLPGSRADCAEPKAEQVEDKELANFCDWFSLDKRYRSPSPGEKKAFDAANKAKEAFSKLFGD
jgi:hypothetical protein